MVSSRPLEAQNEAGSYPNIHGIVVDGDEPVHNFLADLGEPDLGAFLARFDKLSEDGVLTRNPWKQMGQCFKSLRHVSNIWQVAAPSHRLLGFRSGNTLVLTNGFYKTGGETPKSRIKLAKELQSQFNTGH